MPNSIWSRYAPRWVLDPRVGFFSAFALLIIGIFAGLYEEELYRTQKLQETVVEARILADSVAAALVFNDPNAAQEYARAFAENPEVEAAGVFDASRKRIGGFVRAGSDPLPQTVAPRPAYFAGGYVSATLPVIQNGSAVGTVYMRETTDSLQRRFVRYGGIILLVTMGVLVMAIVGRAQLVLSRANATLETQARDLSRANAKLQSEIQERAKAEEALRQSQKIEAIGQLSGGIAHDFNNLITIVKGNLQLMQRRMIQGQADVSRYVNASIDALNRAAGLTQRILAFSRRQPLSPKPVNLSQLVAGMGDLLKHSVGQNVEMETRLDADWWTLCDTNQMENVILNLAINARDAMPDGGHLAIETENVTFDSAAGDVAPGEYVRLSVSDTGLGMTDEVREKAIEPFFTTKPVGQGTGLGLSVTFGYIRQSNGYLSIESAVGKGTAIRILMPRFNVERLSASA